MSHLSYEESKKLVMKGLIILAIVTLAEVFVALLGKGYLVKDFHLPVWLMYILMIVMSLYKAYFIVYYFMHMKYEVPGLVKSVLLPTLLLVWAVIAFFTEGKTWHDWRAQKNDRPIGSLTGLVDEKAKDVKSSGHGTVDQKENQLAPAHQDTLTKKDEHGDHSNDAETKKEAPSHH
ncbi:MAG: cytochrome C oxidase subunit IV family protein [Saprospiraceae bacterium]|nr:cytochrome C oxidase subunit IV family protein [Saprospiraceae bacterium]